MPEKVYIRGKALLCSRGDDLELIISAVKENKTDAVQLPVIISGLDYSRPYYMIARKQGHDYVESFYDILYTPVKKAIADAGLIQREISEMGIFFGSTSMDMPIFEQDYKKNVSAESGNLAFIKSYGYGKIASAVAGEFGIKGPCYTYNTACTSSANGIFYASEMIRTGILKRALIIGFDMYNDLGFLGFEALKLLAPSEYRPFDKNRDGIIMGEGCGAMILDTVPSSPGDFYYVGGANICDTTNVTSHDTEGRVIANLLTASLKNSGLNTGDIDLIKAHATGSYNNDLAECRGYKKIFGDNMPPVTGIKPYVGHTVGASGAVEAIIMSEAARKGFAPASPGFKEYDEELGITPLTKNMPVGECSLMLNFFGFGGNCTSIIISNKR